MNIDDQFNADVTAIMDDAWGELFAAEDGTEFTGQFTLFRSDSIDDAPGNYSNQTAELRWQESAFPAPTPEHLFLRQKTGVYWRMSHEPEVDGGEVIATVYKVEKSRTGAV